MLRLGRSAQGGGVDPFVAQLARLCTAHRTRAKWVFVPTHAVGRTLGERLALEGTDWLNLRFVTPLDIALRMGAPFLVERGIDPSEEGLGPALIMRLLLDLPEEGGYFRPLADQPTMAQALWATIRELRMAGVKSADLKPEAFASPTKHAELVALLASYEQFLADQQARRHGARVRRGGEASRLVPDSAGGLLDRAAGRVWTPLQRQLIDAMPGERIVPERWRYRAPRLRVVCGRVASSVVAASADDRPARVPDGTRQQPA